jgi:hypothetical protein
MVLSLPDDTIGRIPSPRSVIVVMGETQPMGNETERK